MSRTLTVDRRLHSRLVRSLTWRHLRTRALLHLLVVIASGAGVGAVSGSGDAAVATSAVVAVLVVVWWRSRVVRSLRWGVAPGQEITLGYAPTGELSLLDVTGRLWLPRGAALGVVPSGPLSGIIGRDVVLAVPTELLEPEDVAFLEGNGDPGPADEPPAPRPRHSHRVDEQVRADLVAAWTRRALRTADVLLWAGLAVVFLAFAVVTLLQGAPVAAVFFVITAVVSLAGAVPFLRRGQDTVRARHPVGLVLRGDVDRTGITLAGTHTTAWSPWEAYRGHRLDGRTLRLLRRDEAFGGVQVVPAALFPRAALAQVTERLPEA